MELKLEDVSADPNRFGLPTFEEFRQNPDKWRLPRDLILQKIDEGSKQLYKLRKHIYIARFPDGREVRCGESLAKCEQVLRDEGYDILKCKLKPDLREDHSTGLIALVVFEVPSVAEQLGIYTGMIP